MHAVDIFLKRGGRKNKSSQPIITKEMITNVLTPFSNLFGLKALKSIPVVGGIAGAAIEITADITKDTLVAASTAQLEASAFVADIEQVFTNFMAFLDLNSCHQEIPAVKSRFPNIAQLAVLLQKEAEYEIGYATNYGEAGYNQRYECRKWSDEEQEAVEYILVSLA